MIWPWVKWVWVFVATKDLDVVLCVELLDKSFVAAFWAFIRQGGYQFQGKAEGKKRYYRFQRPTTDGYPVMLELFSRALDTLPLAEDSHLTPIPVEEDVSSLSAILLNDDYYEFLHTGKRVLDGLSFVGPEHLLPLKARAWLDLSAGRLRGEPIDSNDIRKHRNDVFRLYQIVSPDFSGTIPGSVKNDLKEFISRVAREEIDLKSCGIGWHDCRRGSIGYPEDISFGLRGDYANRMNDPDLPSRAGYSCREYISLSDQFNSHTFLLSSYHVFCS